MSRSRVFRSLAGLALLAGLLGSAPAARADIIYVEPLTMYADRTTLNVTVMEYQGKYALKLSFGAGVDNLNIGLVYKEGFGPEDNEKINVAMNHLLDVLNDDDIRSIKFKTLTEELGLSFDRLIKSDELKMPRGQSPIPGAPPPSPVTNTDEK